MVVTPRDEAEHVNVRTSRALQLLQSFIVSANSNAGAATVTLQQLEFLRTCLHQHLDRRASSGAAAVFECMEIFEHDPEIFTSDMRSYLLSSYGETKQKPTASKLGSDVSVFQAGKPLAGTHSSTAVYQNISGADTDDLVSQIGNGVTKETGSALFMDPKTLYCLSTGSKDTSHFNAAEMSRIIKAVDQWGFDVYDAQKVLARQSTVPAKKGKEKTDSVEPNQSHDVSVLVFAGLTAVLRHDGVLDVIAGGDPGQYTKAVTTLARFLRRVGSFYKRNAYHNVEHAADIVQTVNWFLLNPKLSKAMSAKDKLTMIISAAIHDIGHLGVNNDFLVATGHEHAITYNDQSPMENMHCCLAFQIVKLHGCNIFGQLSNEAFKEVRTVVIQLVLATDMKHHFDTVGSLQDKQISFADGERKEQIEVMKIILHAADISNPAKPFPIARRWAENITEEFYNQGDRQRSLGMKPSYGHDKFHPVPMPKSQSGFIKALVLPLFEKVDQAVVELDLQVPVRLLHANVDRWQTLLAKMNAESIELTHSKHEANRTARLLKSLPNREPTASPALTSTHKQKDDEDPDETFPPLPDDDT